MIVSAPSRAPKSPLNVGGVRARRSGRPGSSTGSVPLASAVARAGSPTAVTSKPMDERQALATLELVEVRLPGDVARRLLLALLLRNTARQHPRPTQQGGPAPLAQSIQMQRARAPEHLDAKRVLPEDIADLEDHPAIGGSEEPVVEGA